MTLEREALEFLLCLVPKHRLLSDDPVPILRAALDRLEAAEAKLAEAERQRDEFEDLLRVSQQVVATTSGNNDGLRSRVEALEKALREIRRISSGQVWALADAALGGA